MNELELLKKENAELRNTILSIAKGLSTVKADAVIKFAEFLRYSYDGAMSADSIEDTADEYANKLRGES